MELPKAPNDAMRYNVAQLLKEGIGATRDYSVDGTFTDDRGAEVRALGEVHLMRTDKGILVTARLEVLGQEFVCARCLQTFRQDVAFTFTEEFLPTVDVETGESLFLDEVLEGDAFTVDPHHILDLSEAVRQYSILNAPMKPLCRPDCEGICPRCGANRNTTRCSCAEGVVDPRWARLLEIRNQLA